MRAVNHHFVFELGIGALHPRHHVARVQFAHVGDHLAVNLYPQFDWSEARLLRGRQQFVHRLARQPQQLLAGLAR